MRRLFLAVMAFMLALSVVLGTPAAQAAVSPDGYRDFQFGSSCNSTPTGEKPESKLWWNDGSWWGSLCATDNHYHIFRLNLANNSWVDTGTLLDDRPTTKADTLWDAANQKLYVASHVFTTSAAATSTQSNWGRLYRYSYSAGIYSLDPGFPVTVSRGKSEAMVLAKASNGTLWVTYVESNKVMVNHSSSSDSSWGTPYVLPVAGASNLSSDDISANITFDTMTASPKIGVMWSNQNDKKVYFAVHVDSDQSDQSWTSFSVFSSDSQNPAAADDHLNIKLQSDGKGVYAVTKTSNSQSAAPLIVLLSCVDNCAAAGGWQKSVIYSRGDNHTRAILLINTSRNELNVFSANEGGGSIYRKVAPISNNITFVPGHGDLFIKKTASDAKINNPTSTKQNLNTTTGLVVLASDEVSRYYLHNYDPLGGSAPVDTTPPTVSSTTPANSANDVSTGTSVTAIFSEAIDASTMTPANFTLTGPNGAVTASVSYTSGSTTAVLQPSAALAPSTTYTAQVSGVKDVAGNVITTPYSWSFSTAAAPAPGSWTSQNIGSASGGGTTINGSSVTVQGAGTDIWGSADSFRFAYQPASGDVVLTAKVTQWVGGGNSWAKGGLMLRASSAANAANCLVLLSGGNGMRMQWRASTGGGSAISSSVSFSPPSPSAPVWLQLRKSGSSCSAYYGSDGVTWQAVGSPQSIGGLGSSLLAGMAVTAHDATKLATATFDAITVASP